MFFVNLFVIARLMRLSPLKFLRRDLSTSKRKKAMRIPSWSFMNRFRMRIFLQNLGGYIVLLFGILFVMILLAFSVGLPETLDHYKAQMDETLISKYEYILKECHDEEGNLITTSVDGAEKFSITNLFTTDGVRVGENVTVYGFSDSSSYIKISEELKDNEVMISSNYADKFGLGNGDKITLKEKYTDSEYDFEIKGVYDYPGGIAIFIGNDAFNGIFGKDEGSYTGFLSDKEIDDIDNDYIYSVITVEDMMSLSIQLDHSMGSYMTYLSVACLVIGVLVIYLLTKQIIDKNATSISMVKVLGYENSEINSLYILLTTIVVVVFSVLSALLSISVLTLLFRVMMYSMAGWFEVYISPSGVVKMVAIMVASYLIVSLFDMIRIRRIPLTEALKNVE